MATRQRQQQQKYTAKQQKQVEVYPISAYRKSPETKRMYVWAFNRFLKWIKLSEDDLLKLDTKYLQSKIIEYLSVQLSERDGLKRNTVEVAMNSIFWFCTMNDIFLNKKKISDQIPDDEDRKDDRSYNSDEIAEMFRQATDERYRACILLMANGLRVGAIPELQIGDLEKMSIGPKGEILDNDNGIEKLYMIWVYKRSAKHRYYMFCTPECRIAIDKYLADRAGRGDPLHKDSPLIRERFNKGDTRTPRKLTVNAIKKGIERIVARTSINHKDILSTHGLRKFAITQMIFAGVQYEIREYVSGHKHSRGLDPSYDRLTPDKRLQMFAPAINYLTIDKTLNLEKKLKVLQGEQSKEIQELKAQLATVQNKLATVQNKIYDRDRRRMGLYDKELKPGVEGKKIDITEEEWRKENQKWIDMQK